MDSTKKAGASSTTQQLVSSFGRPIKKVDYIEEDDDCEAKPKSKKAPQGTTTTFTEPISNVIDAAIRSGYKPSLNDGFEYVLSIGSIYKPRNSKKYEIYGKFIDNTGKIYEKWEYLESQPKPTIISILSIARDLDIDNNESQSAYEYVTSKLIIANENLSIYDINETVKYKKIQQYGASNEVLSMPIELFKITECRPHDVVGDFSKEYYIEPCASASSTYEPAWVHESLLRPSDWVPDSDDKFDTTINGMYLYEAQRAYKFDIFDYLDDCGLERESLPPYMNVESVYFHNKPSYIAYNNTNIGISSECGMLLKHMIDNKIKSTILYLLQQQKPQLQVKSIKLTANDIINKGTSMECIEMSFIDSIVTNLNFLKRINNNNNNNNNNYNNNNNSNDIEMKNNNSTFENSDIVDDTENILHFTDSTMWLVFNSFDALGLICNFNETAATITLDRGTQLQLVIDKDRPLQFKWFRNTLKFGIELFSFKTIKTNN